MGTLKTKKLISKSEVSKVLKLKNKDLAAFEAEGIFSFHDKAKNKIDGDNFERLRVAVALKRDLKVNLAGIDVILSMRERMDRMHTDFKKTLFKLRKRLGKRLEVQLEKIEKSNR